MNNIEILEDYIKHDTDLVNLPEYDAKIVYKAIENLIQENKELKEVLEKVSKDLDNIAYDQIPIEMQRAFGKEYDLGYRQGWYNAEEDWKSKVKEKIEEKNKRIDYLDKELAEAYIQREKLGTETELDANEQYIYNMEQERSIRYTEKYAYLKLLEGDNK